MGDAATIGIRGTAFGSAICRMYVSMEVAKVQRSKNSETAAGALKFGRSWKREYAHWTMAFDPGEPTEIP
jgi:hypothetical protein